MALIKFNDYVPVRFNSLVDDLLDEAFTGSNGHQPFRPQADILERDGDFEIHMTLPGVNKKDITINIDKNILTVKGSNHPEEDKENVRYHLRESLSGDFERAFQLPEDTKEDKIKADFEDGILRIRIPKDKEKPLKRTIAIG